MITRLYEAHVLRDAIIAAVVAKYPLDAAQICAEYTSVRREQIERRRALARELYAELKSTYRVAERMAVSHMTVWKWLQGTGVLKPQHAPRYDAAQRKRAKAIVRKHGYAEAQRQTGINDKTLRKWFGSKSPKSRTGVAERIARERVAMKRIKAERERIAAAALARENVAPAKSQP